MIKELGGILMQPDFIMYVAVQLIGLGVIYGSMRTQVKYIEKSIERLEKKQDKHNGLVSRMYVVEEKIENVAEKVGVHIEDGKKEK